MAIICIYKSDKNSQEMDCTLFEERFQKGDASQTINYT